jgi:hypothetical protein
MQNTSFKKSGKIRQVNPRRAFVAGLSTGLKSQTEREAHFAIASVYAGNEKKFVSKAKLVFLCKRNTAQAHDEMYGDCYRKYFVEQILASLSLESVNAWMTHLTAAVRRNLRLQNQGGNNICKNGLQHITSPSKKKQ